ncbi:protein kinase [Paenibacillus sp. MAH-34]|uniref:Protein kinase n=2 Tax=Paenibacillus TaxID=44249 RepID=A0ABW9U3T2_9BACL|nr:protein kinase [Paenibacillus anseongense]
MVFIRMNFNLPMMINKKLEYNVNSERVYCSDTCLYKTKEYLAFHLSGLGGSSNHLDLPLITVQNTFVKKKNNSKRKCNHLTYNYEILPNTQFEIFENLRSDPIPGLLYIQDQCSCSYETEYFSGDLAYCESLPITEYYLRNFHCKEDWNNESLIEFVCQTSRVLVELQKRSLIHGDVAAHNFLINDRNEIKLIDLDNFYFGNDEMIVQEICAYVLYTVFPIMLSFKEFSSAEIVVSNFFDALFNNSNVRNNWPEVLISFIDKNDGDNISDFNKYSIIMRAYLYNLKILKENYQNNVSLSNRTQQLQTELLEAIRVKNNYSQELTETHNKQLNEINIYVNSLETQYKESSTYAKTLEEQVAEMKKYILSLETNLTETRFHAKKLEEQNIHLDLELSEKNIKNSEQIKTLNEWNKIIIEQKASIDELKKTVEEEQAKIEELNKRKRKYLF